MPKYRGRDDEWLDDQKSAKKGAVPKKKARPSVDESRLSIAQTNGTVSEIHPRFAKVRLDDATERLCTYRRAKMWTEHEGGYRERSPVAVGDRVKVESSDSTSGVIEGVANRNRFLARPAPDQGDKMIHVLAANIDIVAIVASSSNPDFSPGLVDRFLIAAGHASLEAWIIITKQDLRTEASDRGIALYQSLGYPVFPVCAKSGFGMDELARLAPARKIVFCGHSGVGKTSLLNALTGRTIGREGATNALTGKGRHTTTSAILIDNSWIDTPGVREFGLWGITSDRLHLYYPEFAPLECNQRNCLHLDCEATKLPRHEAYLRIYEALVEDESEVNTDTR